MKNCKLRLCLGSVLAIAMISSASAADPTCYDSFADSSISQKTAGDDGSDFCKGAEQGIGAYFICQTAQSWCDFHQGQFTFSGGNNGSEEAEMVLSCSASTPQECTYPIKGSPN